MRQLVRACRACKAARKANRRHSLTSSRLAGQLCYSGAFTTQSPPVNGRSVTLAPHEHAGGHRVLLRAGSDVQYDKTHAREGHNGRRAHAADTLTAAMMSHWLKDVSAAESRAHTRGLSKKRGVGWRL